MRIIFPHSFHIKKISADIKHKVNLPLWPLLRPEHHDDSCFLFERFLWRLAILGGTCVMIQKVLQAFVNGKLRL